MGHMCIFEIFIHTHWSVRGDSTCHHTVLTTKNISDMPSNVWYILACNLALVWYGFVKIKLSENDTVYNNTGKGAY